ncbi:DUF1996 domain-containing protein [Micromonospora sp. NPDC049679]|uniref:DUF1996 domain-containing protein n=1 Tax=Micromonospora sp. NPDC049679 TaxID=3155920 RepID=UPI0033F2527B
MFTRHTSRGGKPTASRTRRTAAILVATLAAVGALAAKADADPTAAHSAHDHGVGDNAEQSAAIRAQQAVPAALRGSEFRADCTSKGRSGDDPIVKPGQPGASHIHEFSGNTTTNAYSTLQSLRLGGTTCEPRSDLSAYWTPTLYKNGVPVAPERVTVYYQGIFEKAGAVTPPQGLRIVVGNALATSPAQNPAARWSCVGHPQSSADFLNCPPGSKLETYLDFPTCWDGVNVDSPDHKSHVQFIIGGVGGHCPPGYPKMLPRTEFLITYPVNGGGLSLAGTRNGANVTNAPGYTFHGDWINAWEPNEFERRMNTCIRAGYVCGTNGNPIG